MGAKSPRPGAGAGALRSGYGAGSGYAVERGAAVGALEVPGDLELGAAAHAAYGHGAERMRREGGAVVLNGLGVYVIGLPADGDGAAVPGALAVEAVALGVHGDRERAAVERPVRDYIEPRPGVGADGAAGAGQRGGRRRDGRRAGRRRGGCGRYGGVRRARRGVGYVPAALAGGLLYVRRDLSGVRARRGRALSAGTLAGAQHYDERHDYYNEHQQREYRAGGIAPLAVVSHGKSPHGYHHTLKDAFCPAKFPRILW